MKEGLSKSENQSIYSRREEKRGEEFSSPVMDAKRLESKYVCCRFDNFLINHISDICQPLLV